MESERLGVIYFEFPTTDTFEIGDTRLVPRRLARSQRAAEEIAPGFVGDLPHGNSCKMGAN